jgi:hypothetical protein
MKPTSLPWTVDAHRDDGKRLVVRADEKLTAFIELELAIQGCGYERTYDQTIGDVRPKP